MTESDEHPMPDAVERDPAALNSAEDLDEDRLRVDPLEEGVEPPERWSEADRFGMTPREQRQGESLDDRLAEEEPDVDAPGGAVPGPRSSAVELGQNADKAGGSVAETIRTPGEAE